MESQPAGAASEAKQPESHAAPCFTRVRMIPPRSPLPKRTPWQIQRAVVFALFVRELKTRFGGRWLGAFWALLEPVAHVAVMMVIFGWARHRVLPGVEYPVFLLTGLVPFFLFRNLALRGMQAIDANRGLFAYRQVKPADPLVARAIIEVALYGIVYLLALAALGRLGLDFLPSRPLELIGVSAMLVAAGSGLGLLFAVATNEFPNARSLVSIAFLPLYLMSGIIFPISALPTELLPWLLWNPVLHAIELSRGYFLPQYPALPQLSVLYVALFALATIATAMSLYRVRRHRLIAT